MSYLLEFDVAEDASVPGCAVCRGAQRAGAEHVRGFLYEDANNPSARALLERSGGLCRDHLFVAARIAEQDEDTMGISILVEFLLDVARRRIAQVQRPSKGRRRRRGPVSLLARGCPACDVERRQAESYLDILAGAGADGPSAGGAGGEEISAGYALAEHGLCLVHLEMGLSRTGDDEGRALLVRSYSNRASQLRRQVQEHISKQSARRAAEGPGSESAAWREACDWLVGLDRCPRK